MRFKSLLLFLLISIPCCLTKPETRDFSENQKFQPIFTKTNIQAKKSELKSIKRKPLWAKNIDEWKKKHGDHYKVTFISIAQNDVEPILNQLVIPSKTQFENLKDGCTKFYELIDYFWFGEREATQLYGLCIDKNYLHKHKHNDYD